MGFFLKIMVWRMLCHPLKIPLLTHLWVSTHQLRTTVLEHLCSLSA